VARIYVIDDDAQLLRMVGLMLERAGHAVTLINDPMQGLDQINAHPPDLLVIDVMMPGKSGHDITREIRNTKGIEELPVLVLTARSQDVDRRAALNSGADAYLSKPVTSQELTDLVDQLLSKKPAADKSQQQVMTAVYGFRGGTGKTTLAVNIAGALRRLSQQEVCLIDFSPAGGQVAYHLRLQARQSWADLPEANQLDWPTLEKHLTVHQSGIHVLAAPSMPHGQDVLTEQKTTAILNLLQEHMMFTVVDLPAIHNACLRAVLPMSYMAMHVVAPDIVSVQTAAYTNQLLAKEGINIKYRSHILNHVIPTPALSPQAMERGLNHRFAFQIGYDPQQQRALAQGMPVTLAAIQSPLSVVVSRMAEAIWQRVATTMAHDS
jgi:pilus assembly protein CpaE